MTLVSQSVSHSVYGDIITATAAAAALNLGSLPVGENVTVRFHRLIEYWKNESTAAHAVTIYSVVVVASTAS